MLSQVRARLGDSPIHSTKDVVRVRGGNWRARSSAANPSGVGSAIAFLHIVGDRTHLVESGEDLRVQLLQVARLPSARIGRQ
jgi:hypothetical protein